MARINLIIKAFESDELSMLAEIVEREEIRATETGYILPSPFEELKHTIQSANRYSNGMERNHTA